MDFTDLNLTAYGGSSILAEMARQHGLVELLADAVAAHGWDYSISLTNDTWRQPVWSRSRGFPTLLGRTSATSWR